MDTKAIKGSFSIIIMFLLLLSVINYIDTKFASNGFVILGIIILVGLVNGYIFSESVKKSILYIVVVGEAFVLFLFIFLLNNYQSSIENSTGLEGIGLIIIFIVLIAFLIAGFIGLLLFGIVIFIPASIGKSFKDRKRKRNNLESSKTWNKI